MLSLTINSKIIMGGRPNAIYEYYISRSVIIINDKII